jgi:Flp pilus assembly protein TadG
MTMNRKALRSGRGSTIVEFALVFPLLLLLMFGVMDFGFYFFVQHSLQFATREGVRLALVGRTIANPDGSGNQLSRVQSIVTTIQNKASVAVKPADVSVSVFPVDATFADPAGWQNTQEAGLPGSYMRVKSRYTYRFITPLIGALVPGRSKVIEVQATYRNELFNY